MAEPNRLAELDQTGCLGNLAGSGRQPECVGRRRDQVHVAGGIGRRDQEPELDVAAEETDLAQVERLQVPADGDRLVAEAGLGELGDGELVCQVDQGKRIAAGRRRDLHGDGGVELLGDRAAEQPHRSVRAEPADTQCRDAGQLGRVLGDLAPGEEQCCGLRLEPATHERQRVEGLTIQQVRIVDDRDDRDLLTNRAEQAQDAEPDHEPVGRRSHSLAGGDAQRLLEPLRELRQVRPQRRHQALDRRERHRRLGLVPVDRHHLHPRQIGSRGRQQRGLPDPGIARDRQRTAPTVAGVAQHCPDVAKLVLTS